MPAGGTGRIGAAVIPWLSAGRSAPMRRIQHVQRRAGPSADTIVMIEQETPAIPLLVAHRGDAQRFPENTLPALEAALRAGACFVEFDVQLTADLVPVLLHDASLLRTAAVNACVMDLRRDELRGIAASEPAQFGSKFGSRFAGPFGGVAIPTLREAVELLRAWPRATAFVEIKEESLGRFGTDQVVRAIMDDLRDCAGRCVPISFSAEAVRLVKAMGLRAMDGGATGWVIGAWVETVKTTAEELSPEFLFCDYTQLPAEPYPLWPGHWRWALYEVTEPELALSLARRGADLIETMAITEMLAHPLLRKRACLPKADHARAAPPGVE